MCIFFTIVFTKELVKNCKTQSQTETTAYSTTGTM